MTLAITRTLTSRSRLFVVLFFLVVAFALAPRAAHAAGVVGDGTPGSCTKAAIDAALQGGGLITFNCGPNPLVIAAGPHNITADTIIDGGGLITLDGEETRRLLVVLGLGPRLTVRNITLARGLSTFAGGAIFSSNDVEVANSVFIGNRVTNDGGGAIGVGLGQLTVESSRFHGNRASSGGGAISLSSGKLTVRNSVFEMNEGHDGGAIRVVDSDTSVESSYFLDNSGENGGGINVRTNLEPDSANLAQILVYGSTFEENMAAFGAAIAEQANGNAVITISNSTFFGNNGYTVGSTIVEAERALAINYSTFTANTLNYAGFIIGTATEAPATLTGVIVDGTHGASPPSCNQSATSGGGNVAFDQSCDLTHATDRQNTAPLLGPLAHNGGSTLTVKPLAGSPSINRAAGIDCPIIDQRGYPRPGGGVCDAGAVESDMTIGNPPPVVPPPPAPPNLPPLMPPLPPEDPPLVYAPATGGVAPTVTLSKSKAARGDEISLTGSVTGGIRPIKVSSVHNGQTIGNIRLMSDAAGKFGVDLVLPLATQLGAFDLCAAVLDDPNARLGCATLTVEPGIPYPVGGSLAPEIVATNAIVSLSPNFNDPTQPVLSAPVTSQGGFNIPGVQPGIYEYTVSGQLSHQVPGGVIEVKGKGPEFTSVLKGNPLGDIRYCPFGDDSGLYTISATPSQPIPKFDPDAAITAVHRNTVDYLLNRAEAGEQVSAAALKDWQRPFGYYVSGVEHNVRFDIRPTVERPIRSILVEFMNPGSNAPVHTQTLTGNQRSVTFNVGLLQPSTQTRHARVQYTVVYEDGTRECTMSYPIHVLANPFGTLAQPNPSAIVWDTVKRRYNIQAVLPYIPGVWPFNRQILPPPLPALPFVGGPDGRFDNHINGGIQIIGYMDIKGDGMLQVIDGVAQLTLMDKVLLGPNTRYRLMTVNADFHSGDWKTLHKAYGPITLLDDYVEIPLFKVPVVTFAGILTANVYANAGIGGSLGIGADVWPFYPLASIEVVPTGRAHLELGVSISLFLGLAEAGASQIIGVGASLPVTIQVPPAIFVDLCLHFDWKVRAFWSIGWGLEKGNATATLIATSRCMQLLPTAYAVDENGNAITGPPTYEEWVELAGGQPLDLEPNVPDLLALPVIAIGSDGRQISAWVENRAAPGATQDARVMVRQRANATAAWGSAVAVSLPNRAVSSPRVAFVGAANTPLVVWTENTLSPAQEATLGGESLETLRHQEIVYSTLSGANWSAPTFLTNDNLPDGLPVLAGGVNGAVLAWVRDVDGNPATRADQRIAAAVYDTATGQFGDVRLLGGSSVDSNAPGMNGNVHAAWDDANRRAWLTWIHDADADLLTAGDRRVVVSFHEQGSGLWSHVNTGSLHAHADSPSISANGKDVLVAWLVRPAAEDGDVAIGGVDGVAMVARLGTNGWQVAPLLDEEGSAVFGERPVLAPSSDGHMLLFRRFGREVDNSQFGQIVISAIMGNVLSAPLYITDEPNQNWYADFAVDPTNGSVHVVKVAREALIDNPGVMTAAEAKAASIPIAASRAVPSVEKQTLNDEVLAAEGRFAAADPVESLSLSATADPALDPLAIDFASYAPGEQVVVTVTVRNVGINPTGAVTVRLHRDSPSGPELAAAQNIPAGLGLNASATVVFSFNSTGATLPIHVRLSTTGANGSTANDTRAITINQIASPSDLRVSAGFHYSDTLQINWFAPETYVAGYRVLRGATPSGPWELAGESAHTGFIDIDIEAGSTYCYSVQAYNRTHLSAQSPASCYGVPMRSVWLPLIDR